MSSLLSISQQIDPEIRSDKSEAYLHFYEELFDQQAERPLNILEVGVFKGGSMLMFAEYFKNSNLLGIDIHPPPPKFDALLAERQFGERVKIALGAQNDSQFLQSAITLQFGTQPLDLVIDDASHTYRRTRATFETVFYQFLKPGGSYIIEDWGCGYWPRWRDGNPNGKHGLPRLIKDLVDIVALSDRTKLFQGRRAMRVREEQKSPIEKMTIVPGIVVLVKAQSL